MIIEAEDPFSFDLKEQGQEFEIKEFVRHPNYETSKVYFDVAIIGGFHLHLLHFNINTGFDKIIY